MGDRSFLEIVAVGDPRAEMLAILRNYYRRVKDGQLTGIVVLAEMPDGAYRAACVSSTENLAERLGRLRLIRALDLLEAELIKEGQTNFSECGCCNASCRRCYP